MFLLWHPSLTAINLSYTFPILETSATALCGTTGNSYQKMARETCRNSPHNHLPKHKEEYRVNSSQPAAQSGGHVQTLIPPMNLTFTTTPQCFFIASLLIAFKHQKNGRNSELGSHIVSSRLSSTCKHVNELWTMGKKQKNITTTETSWKHSNFISNLLIKVMA